AVDTGLMGGAWAAEGVFSTPQALAVSGFPSPTTSGVSGTVTVTAKDAGGNTLTGYTGTVHFTSSDGAAVLPADYHFQASDNGSHSFSVTLNTVGTQSITATDTANATITGTQTGINVNQTIGFASSPTATPNPAD